MITPVLTLVSAAITGLPGTTRLRHPVRVVLAFEEMSFTRRPTKFVPGYLLSGFFR